VIIDGKTSQAPCLQNFNAPLVQHLYKDFHESAKWKRRSGSGWVVSYVSNCN